jgi:hypothetical protein
VPVEMIVLCSAYACTGWLSHVSSDQPVVLRAC